MYHIIRTTKTRPNFIDPFFIVVAADAAAVVATSAEASLFVFRSKKIHANEMVHKVCRNINAASAHTHAHT